MSYRGKEVQGGRNNFGHIPRLEPGASANSYAKELKEMPDYSNAATKETEERLGEFIFDQPEPASNKEIVTRGPYELDNGAVYHG